ncbi:TetR/AcrR family transcriptional regulator [Streptomyces sp. NPDC057794]|uniref:TetR/AcrR family transcriptional regulator n=1 Tax=Streptomyces sp. NPDC057794 TaxID=3346251 RepID=UPI003675FAB2
MARVTQEHLDARRRQILDGAAVCFARNGFHATSMQDVLKEVGLSAGAVYRYFSGKEELIGAIVGEVLGSVRGAFEEASRQSPPPPPDELVASVLGTVFAARASLLLDGRPAFPRLVIQVWPETLRNEELAAVLREGYGSVRAAWAKIVEGYQRAGMMRPDVEPDHVARTMIAVVLGFIAQQSLFGPAPVEVLRDGLRALTSMGDGRSAPEGSRRG